MSKRKLFMSLWFVTILVWIIALIRFEIFLIQLSNYSTGGFGYLFGGFEVPFVLHGIILLTIVSLGAWLWSFFPELLSLYSKELVVAKNKLHEMTAEKEEDKVDSEKKSDMNDAEVNLKNDQEQ
ncbi:hypothetical protein [Enterococcus casseliflavus]|uniref:hypothetical protein n=1 Tax=Enterococcus casseliflavus TaxID=37734 RepID=UPI001BCC6FEE|nr:hypothetical protein [Enterococcus casseliflavus]